MIAEFQFYCSVHRLKNSENKSVLDAIMTKAYFDLATMYVYLYYLLICTYVWVTGSNLLA